MTGDIDIVIVSYNTRQDLGGCLASLHAHPPRRLRHIIVVDNASSDGSPDEVRSRWPAVQVITLERNVGFGAANNVALREAGAPLVLLLNSDTIVPAGAVDRLAECLDRTGAVAAGPRLVDANDRPEISFGRMLSPSSELVQAVRVRFASTDRAWARAYVARLVSTEREVDWVSGACLLVRRAEAAEAGLFDERYFMYEEDVDFCAALRARGGRVLFTPHAEVTHLGGRSTGGRRGAAHGLYDRSHMAFYEKHAPHWLPWLRWWQRVRGRG